MSMVGMVQKEQLQEIPVTRYMMYMLCAYYLNILLKQRPSALFRTLTYHRNVLNFLYIHEMF